MKDQKMLVTFQNKTNRVKGLAFHPRRPWILASLHTGYIQLWDYRMEVLIDSFIEHDGPVRGVDFHSTQPIFVSGGDDYKIKVWNYQLKRCLFNLLGHLDYVRTVHFHQEYPWVLSASDDQTIRIWNWQSRSCLQVLTGHNHYVMCAQFHPREDLIVSASLDQTVRVWDFQGLRKKTVSIASDYSTGASSMPSNDLFGGSDVIVKHVLDGHTRGVNWASFHHTLSLVVSGADDREVKLWRMNETKAWEVDTMRGHINNVSCVLFHPKKELIISNSEDKSIRVWDMSKQQSPLTLRRDSDRYWILAAHPTLNLLAAGHDSGMLVFKLNRERPAFNAQPKNLYYYKDLYIYEYNNKTGKEKPIFSTRRRVNSGGSGPRSLHYNISNRAQHCILLTSDSDSSYELYTFGKDGSKNSEPQTALRGFGRCAVFVSRNRFAVLDKSRQIWLKNLKNETKRKLVIDNAFISYIFPGGIGRLLLRTADCMILYDIQSLKPIAELPTQSRHPIKYVSWSSDNKYVAMFSKANIYIANSKLEECCTMFSNSRVKSGAWDGSVFVYATATHIKYLLTNGDSGIIRALDVPIYLTSVAASTLTYLDREAGVSQMQIDATEYHFKVALMRRRNKDVLRLMHSKKLVGQSIIGYLQQKGYPEVALHFVQDEKIKFGLALECGNIGVALECASALDNTECWHKLGVEALRQGNHQVVEAAYQKTKNFERLSFLYLITGNLKNLAKMQHIAGLRGDISGRFHNSLYLGDVEERVKVLADAGQLKLAYVTARVHGLKEEALALQEQLGEDVPAMPKITKPVLMLPPAPVLKEANWPLLEIKKGFFAQLDQEGDPSDDEAPEDEDEEAGSDEEDAGGAGGWGDLNLGGDEKEEKAGEGEEEGGGGWGDDMDIGLPEAADDEDGEKQDDDDDDTFVMPLSGKNAFFKWSSQSNLAPELIAAGAFDQAMHLLHRQIGLINFEPVKSTFLSIYQSGHCYLPQLPGTLDLVTALSRSTDDESSRPVLGWNLSHPVDLLKKAYKAVTDGKFQAAVTHFKKIVQILPFLVVAKKAQIQEVAELKDICREYITAMRLELARKNAKDPVRAAALAAYCTQCKLQPIHSALFLRVAIKCSYTIKNYKTTGTFCRRIMELVSSAATGSAVQKIVNLKQIRGVLKLCEKENSEAKPIDYDDSKAFSVCCSTFTCIHRGKPLVRCPYCQSPYHSAKDGKLCATCELSKIGAETTGLLNFQE